MLENYNCCKLKSYNHLDIYLTNVITDDRNKLETFKQWNLKLVNVEHLQQLKENNRGNPLTFLIDIT